MTPFTAKTGITYFEHVITPKHGNSLLICSDPYYISRFFEKKYSRPEPDIYPKSGIFLWSGISALHAYDEQMIDMQQNFNIDHGITFINAGDEKLESFDFATTTDRQDLVNYYLNNQGELQGFFNSYKDQFERFFVKLAENIPKIPLRPKHFRTRNISDNQIATFTTREIECLELLCKAFTAKMTARALDISPRTVERHLENIKIRLNIKYKAELINVYSAWKSTHSVKL